MTNGERAVLEARTWLGTPYRHQASLKGAGADCLGLLRGVWRAVYGAEPMQITPYTADWSEASGREDLLQAIRLEGRDARCRLNRRRIDWILVHAVRYIVVAFDDINANLFVNKGRGVAGEEHVANCLAVSER